MVVGVTGGIGSGKTTVVNFFKAFKNVAIYMADIEAKKLIQTSETIKYKLQKVFGKNVYKNKELQRAFLADIVFNDAEKLALLNSIVHPEVAIHFQNFIAKNKDKAYILYENAILFENGSNTLCDVIISVTVPIDIRIKRILHRDKTSKEAILARIKNQWKEEKKTIQSNYLIENNQLDTTKKSVDRIHTLLVQKQRVS